jgi:ABC-2 type transport system ATP-binding protein
LSNSAVIELNQLRKRYGNIVAIDDLSLGVEKGQTFALLGPNGAGKTTLMHILCSILRPDSGRAIVAGFDVVRQPLKARKNISVVFQEPSLDDRLTVIENLSFHCAIFNVPPRERKSRIHDVLELVELAPWRDRLVRSLSSGMKRRLEIARALTHDAQIVFLDEPTAGLDVQTRARIWDYLRELRRRRELTLVVTTHQIDEVENCDEVCIIDHGKILAKGTPRDLKTGYGQRLFHLTALDDEARSIILAHHPDAMVNGLDIALQASDPAFADDIIARFGSRICQFTIENPSLESVFLSLTGRELRDSMAAGRDRTYAFGRRGGEQTR